VENVILLGDKRIQSHICQASSSPELRFFVHVACWRI